MRKNIFRKGLVVGIILSIIIVSIIPSLAQNTFEKPLLLLSKGDSVYIGGGEHGYYTIIKNNIDNISDNNTVTIILKSGRFDPKTLTIKGILGYTYCIENRGTKEIWFNSSIIDRTLLNRSFGSQNVSGIIPPQTGFSFSFFSLLSFHPILRMSALIIVNTSSNLTLERSGIILFSCFYIWLTGPESITGLI